jgi:flagellar basal-body rod protein FlgF
MENALLIALSRQTVMERHMEVLANNIANSATPGFKGEQLMFVEYLAQTPNGDAMSFVQDLALVRNYAEGDFVTTGNPLDVAIHGKGWFVVDMPDKQAYTRNGHFSLNAQNQIVTTKGHPILSADGAPITLEPGETGIEVSADGTVSTPSGVKGRFRIVTFRDETALDKAADSLFVTDAAPDAALDAKVVQGMIEGSNVEPIVEVSNMITALRSYQSAQEVILGDDGLLRKAIDVLTDQQT